MKQTFKISTSSVPAKLLTISLLGCTVETLSGEVSSLLQATLRQQIAPSRTVSSRTPEGKRRWDVFFSVGCYGYTGDTVNGT
jgi:hypothetical protein